MFAFLRGGFLETAVVGGFEVGLAVILWDHRGGRRKDLLRKQVVVEEGYAALAGDGAGMVRG